MDRTPEQVAADGALEEAIVAAQIAYGAEQSFLLQDFVVLTAETKLDADGEPVTAYSILHRGGTLVLYKVLGLIEVHRGMLRKYSEEDN